MSRPKLKRPAPGTVLGTLALIVALAGNTGAFAGTGTKITKADIAKGAVTANAIAPGAVRAKALAKNAVHSKALAAGAVNAQDPRQRRRQLPHRSSAAAVTSKALAKGAVGPEALAPDAVTASALAPSSVYGGALGPVTTHGTPIADQDEIAHNGEWTASDTESAACAAGERLLTGGVVFTEPGNREVGIIQSLPVTNSAANAWVARITSDSGGSAAAEVQAVCLK